MSIISNAKMRTNSIAGEVEFYDSAEGWTNSYNKWGDILIEMYPQQHYPQQPTNVFYKLWTNEMTHVVYTNIWREESRPMTQQEKRDLVMTGWTPVYKNKGDFEKGIPPSGLIGYTMKRVEYNEPGKRTTYQILPAVTVKKIEGWEKTIADTNAVFKKDGQIIKAIIEAIP